MNHDNAGRPEIALHRAVPTAYLRIGPDPDKGELVRQILIEDEDLPGYIILDFDRSFRIRGVEFTEGDAVIPESYD